MILTDLFYSFILGALYSVNQSYEYPFYFAAVALFCASATNIFAICAMRKTTDEAPLREQPMKRRGSEVMWMSGTVMNHLLQRRLARRRNAIVDLHLKRHASIVVAEIQSDV